MKTILLFGHSLTVAQAEDYLKRFKQAYELHKEKDTFFFDNQPVDVKFAEYVIHYLEGAIVRNGGTL